MTGAALEPPAPTPTPGPTRTPPTPLPPALRPTTPTLPTSPGRGLWLAPGPPITGWRSFFSSDRLVIYLLIPVGMVLLMGPRFETLRLRQLLSVYLLMATAMAIFGGLFELCYALWERFVPTPPRGLRLAGHVLTWIVVSIAGAYLASWVIEALWGLPAPRLRAQSLRPGLVIGGCVIAVMVAADERRARALVLERTAAAARLAALRAELSALQARTDPHFLFNSINAVASLIPDDPAAAETMLERLAAVFRYALDAGRHPTVPLASELSAVRTYLAVEEVRFGDRLRWHLHADPALDALPIPPLSLQPLVENAVRHGVSARRGATRLDVRVVRSGEALVITVEDQPATAPTAALPDDDRLAAAPPAAAPSSAGSGSALANLRARLALLHGDAAIVTAGPAAPAGWRVELRVPIGAS